MEGLALPTQGPEFKSQNPLRTARLGGISACNPSAGETEAGGPVGLPDQPV